MQSINLVDFGIILIIIFFIFRGYRLGLIRQVISLIALIVAFYLATETYQLLATYLNQFLSIPASVAPTLSFILIIIVVSIMINMVGYILNKLTNFLLLSMLDDLGGAVVGFIKGVLIIYILLILIKQVPTQIVVELIEASVFAEKFLDLTPFLEESLESFTS